ncbi:cupin domain-containing protein [Microbacterium sp. 4R-513]|uniref:cupin domain-containing protein n=1 Tax=Microbacterium sp. 4R-513 TaxID=2567934 RepID=UPI0013E101CD|nr:cupin domain-containing protein [Microbacterium sp. 4R-513]QIG38709.1 cupin domain-containing protein [Microbacterium sp. 4R-513]
MDTAEQTLALIAALAADPEAASDPGTLVHADELRTGRGRLRMFIGADHGAGISYFFVDNEPGQGPGLHRHPYSETWFVLAGEAEIRLGDRVFRAREGDTTTVRPGQWHGFTNVGEGRLRVLCIHASDRIIQEWADEPGVLDIPTL